MGKDACPKHLGGLWSSADSSHAKETTAEMLGIGSGDEKQKQAGKEGKIAQNLKENFHEASAISHSMHGFPDEFCFLY